MRTLIEYFIRKRNSAFVWNDSLPTSALVSFAWQQSMNLLRGLKVMLMVRNPKMMLRGSNVTITGFASLTWGRFLKLGNNIHIDAFSYNGISIGEKVSLGAYSRLIASGSIMNPGKGIKIGNKVMIIAILTK